MPETETQTKQAKQATQTARWLDRIPELEERRRFPSIDPVKGAKLFDEILASGRDAVVGIIDGVVDVNDGTDWKVRFLLHALVTHVSAKGRDRQRTALEKIYAGELSGNSNRQPTETTKRTAEAKTFLAMQLQWFGSEAAIPALVAQLSGKDRELVDACCAALVAIGGASRKALRETRDEIDGHGRVAIDHALGQLERKA